MEQWKTLLESSCKQHGEVKLKRGILHGDSLSPLLFVMAMIPLTTVLRKLTPVCKTIDENTINHLLYMNDLKLYGKSQNDMKTLRDRDIVPLNKELKECPVIDIAIVGDV